MLPSRVQCAFINVRFLTLWKVIIFFEGHGYVGLWLTAELAQIVGIVKDLNVLTYKTHGARWWLVRDSAGPLSGFGCGLVHLIS